MNDLKNEVPHDNLHHSTAIYLCKTYPLYKETNPLLAEIESMFNAGRGRMYLQPEWGEGEGIDIDAMLNVDAYGDKSGKGNLANKPYMSRLSDMSAG